MLDMNAQLDGNGVGDIQLELLLGTGLATHFGNNFVAISAGSTSLDTLLLDDVGGRSHYSL